MTQTLADDNRSVSVITSLKIHGHPWSQVQPVAEVQPFKGTAGRVIAGLTCTEEQLVAEVELGGGTAGDRGKAGWRYS